MGSLGPDPHDIRLCLAAVARWLSNGETGLLPLFLRLEKEVAALDRNDDAATRAAAIVRAAKLAAE